MTTVRNFIGGELVDSASGATMPPPWLPSCSAACVSGA